jgi:hypothetical protein
MDSVVSIAEWQRRKLNEYAVKWARIIMSTPDDQLTKKGRRIKASLQDDAKD